MFPILQLFATVVYTHTHVHTEETGRERYREKITPSLIIDKA